MVHLVCCTLRDQTSDIKPRQDKPLRRQPQKKSPPSRYDNKTSSCQTRAPPKARQSAKASIRQGNHFCSPLPSTAITRHLAGSTLAQLPGSNSPEFPPAQTATRPRRRPSSAPPPHVRPRPATGAMRRGQGSPATGRESAPLRHWPHKSQRRIRSGIGRPCANPARSPP